MSYSGSDSHCLEGPKLENEPPHNIIPAALFTLEAPYNARKRQSRPHRMLPLYPTHFSSLGHLSENEFEDIVEDIIASGTIWEELEGLAVIHRTLLLINLHAVVSGEPDNWMLGATYQQSSSHQD